MSVIEILVVVFASVAAFCVIAFALYCEYEHRKRVREDAEEYTGPERRQGYDINDDPYVHPENRYINVGDADRDRRKSGGWY